MNAEPAVFTVTQLNNLVKAAVEAVPALQNVCVRGEISNYKLYPSGHHYFTLKDAGASVRCVLFKGNAYSLRFRPENGQAVLAIGRVSVFPRDGAYQLYCSRLLPDGAGDLNAAFEQRKEQLYREGLFAREAKKPLPAYPHRICIITSESGAAVHDMIRILGKRYPLSRVLLMPVRVQGPQAAGEIASAIALANARHLSDLLIVGRGGGSLEDLWAFNEEPVARAIFASRIPVISAVGHEPDVTISDFVADVRAATPSNAAELAVPDRQELQGKLQAMQSVMRKCLQRKTESARARLNTALASPFLKDPMNLLAERRQLTDRLTERMVSAQSAAVAEQRRRLTGLAAGLDAMSPLKVLSRGYAVVTKPDGTLIRAAEQTAPGDRIRVTLARGVLSAAVETASDPDPDAENNHQGGHPYA